MAEGMSITSAGDTLEVTIARGDANRFTTAMTGELAERIRVLDHRHRFVLLRAAGGTFCLGREPEGKSAAELRAVSSRIVQLLEAIRESPAIVVCEVGGDAAGFGVGLAAASDVAVSSEDARFWFPELAAGLAPTVVLSWLAHAVSRKRAFELVATGRRISAAEALDHGFITEVVPRDSVSETAARWIELLRSADPTALRDVKDFLRRAGSMDVNGAGRAAADLLALGSLR